MRVELDDGRRVALPMAYVQRGHLRHGYALTAHVAQGSTVDRAFVLGSDELYRECGYTALSRHRAEARFYVCASPTFLNRAPEPLCSSEDVRETVGRMLATSRAERLALDGLAARHRRAGLIRRLERAADRFVAQPASDPLAWLDRWPERPQVRERDIGRER